MIIQKKKKWKKINKFKDCELNYYFGNFLISEALAQAWKLSPVKKKQGQFIMAYDTIKKAYDTIDRHGMCQMLRVYGVGGKLLKAVQSFYVDSKVCGSVLV